MFFFLLLIFVLTSSPFVREPPLSLANAMWGDFFCVFIFILLGTAAASKKTIAHLHDWMKNHANKTDDVSVRKFLFFASFYFTNDPFF
jgi:hypothetical protein